mmetsp:Transcript_129723/g.225386  ORF Transcript_129723/g.225386 Transcript_129723/m.225386 type:complete len:198 (-) Transcript_129723:99-692(-)
MSNPVNYPGMEPGIRPSQFWKWAVNREVRAQSRFRGGGKLWHSSSDSNLSAMRPPGARNLNRLHDPIQDHGLIFRNLHDTHVPPAPREEESPPTPSAVSPWAWMSAGRPQDDSVESAVTAASASAISAMLPGSTLQSGLAPRRPSSLLSTSRPLQAAASIAVESGMKKQTLASVPEDRSSLGRAPTPGVERRRRARS